MAKRRPERHIAPTRVTQEEMDRLFSAESLEWIAWRLEAGDFVAGTELAVAIAANPRQRLPDSVRDYLCRLLRGEVKKKPGRKVKFSFVAEVVLHEA